MSLMSHHPSRRGLMQAALAAAALKSSAAFAQKKIPIALQLWSVRQQAQADLKGTLERVAKMGYEGVEFAGFYGHSASAVAQMLKDCGLKVSSTHTGLKLLQGDEFSKTVEFHQAIGCNTLIVPSLGRVTGADGWLKSAEEMSRVAEKLRPLKMRLGFHNHTMEFQPVDGKVPHDLLYENMPKDVLVQIDIGHAARAGADYLAYIRKYPGRCHSFHMKDYSPTNDKALLGEGTVNFREIFKLAQSSAGTEWYIVEQESYPVPPLESVERCLKNLKNLLA